MRFLGIGKSKAERELGRIMKSESIPNFPGMAMRVLEDLRDPEVEFAAIAERLQWDPALTMQVLKTVNSAAYGVSHPIQDVHHAVSFLGRSALEQIVLAMAVKSALPSARVPGFEPQRFWHTASFRAILAKRIASRLHPATEAESFTAALLQDLAIPVLAHGLTPRYAPILQRWHMGSEADLHALEMDALGWSHDEVGGLLCEAWEMPEQLIQRIASHHSTQTSDLELLPGLRMVALLRETQEHESLDGFISLGRDEYGLSADELVQCLEEAEREAQAMAKAYVS